MSSKLGLLKSVLCKKRGIEKVTIPTSMGKAKGANCEGEEEDVTVIVVQRFPSTTNKQMINVKNEADDAKEAKKERKNADYGKPKELSSMFTRILGHMDVPRNASRISRLRCIMRFKLLSARQEGDRRQRDG